MTLYYDLDISVSSTLAHFLYQSKHYYCMIWRYLNSNTKTDMVVYDKMMMLLGMMIVMITVNLMRIMRKMMMMMMMFDDDDDDV